MNPCSAAQSLVAFSIRVSRTGWRLLKAQALEKRGLMPGDVLCIYTGWGDNWKDPDVEKFYYTKVPVSRSGVGQQCRPARF
jgi:hypothetical protein